MKLTTFTKLTFVLIAGAISATASAYCHEQTLLELQCPIAVKDNQGNPATAYLAYAQRVVEVDHLPNGQTTSCDIPSDVRVHYAESDVPDQMPDGGTYSGEGYGDVFFLKDGVTLDPRFLSPGMAAPIDNLTLDNATGSVTFTNSLVYGPGDQNVDDDHLVGVLTVQAHLGSDDHALATVKLLDGTSFTQSVHCTSTAYTPDSQNVSQ